MPNTSPDPVISRSHAPPYTPVITSGAGTLPASSVRVTAGAAMMRWAIRSPACRFQVTAQ